MDNYTMTFYCKDCLTIPADPRMRMREVQRQVMDKMQGRKLELVDFNLTENYHTYPGYSSRGTAYKTLIEIRLDLSRADFKSRDAIYNRCLSALLQDELYLSDFADETLQNGDPYHIFIFDMKNQAAAS
ncbi:hypothetical protein ACLI1A_15235 [Flavobacterium sp. RHBU_3]|uniref:hypothetical protein n=1 Tax=Flavobacterium sp. RHBU_3 TaxID=3391184 RepID=UPI003984F719